jgi:hypothetical protein
MSTRDERGKTGPDYPRLLVWLSKVLGLTLTPQEG